MWVTRVRSRTDSGQMLLRDEVVVMDMEAGIEHLGQATAKGVDRLIVVVEPGRRSIETALQVKKLADDLGLTKVAVAGNKVRSPAHQEFMVQHLSGLPILGFLPFDERIIEADLQGWPPYEVSPTLVAIAQEIGGLLSEEKTGLRKLRDRLIPPACPCARSSWWWCCCTLRKGSPSDSSIPR